jgi:hypothetical protein
MFQNTNKYSGVGQQQLILNAMDGKDRIISQLQQLYKNGSKATEKSNSKAQTADSGPAGTGNLTSVET